MKKTLLMILTLSTVQFAYANMEQACNQVKELERNPPKKEANEADKAYAERRASYLASLEDQKRVCASYTDEDRQNRARTEEQARNGAQAQRLAENGVLEGVKCEEVFKNVDNERATAKEGQTSFPIRDGKAHKQCLTMRVMSNALEGHATIKHYTYKETQKFSQDQKIKCDKPYSYTADYDACVKALAAYNFIVNSEAFMNLQQTVRTDVKNNNINQKAAKAAEAGDIQSGMFDAAVESNQHMKQMEAEKAAGYTAAVAALGRAYAMIPDEEDIYKDCQDAIKRLPSEVPLSKDDCVALIKEHSTDVIANKDVKGALFEAITQFTAKGIAAGIKMKQYDTKANAIAEAAKTIQPEGEDMMIELCQAAPNDPACITSGNRVSNSGTFSPGSFSIDGDGGNNVFGLTPEGDDFGEIGAATNLDDKNEVAGVNSPFMDEAKIAKGIMDPAAAASVQATGGAQGGGGGGVGGGLGGGGASLGSDLEGAKNDADKEAQIKATKVSGSYGNLGGGGYKGIAGSKRDDKNPFASLFDQKGGVVDGDRAIASGDIDGKASGLFEKISKRYGQIQADKRVEAKNLE